MNKLVFEGKEEVINLELLIQEAAEGCPLDRKKKFIEVGMSKLSVNQIIELASGKYEIFQDDFDDILIGRSFIEML